MVKTKAPLRISFAGGGSDIEPYCSEYGGCVLSGTIDIYAHAEYPSEPHEASALEETICCYFGEEPQFLKVTSEAPPMSGLGGSASCFVAGIKAMKPKLEPQEIAELAFDLERNIMGVAGGKQDQYISALGGLNLLKFDKNSVSYDSVLIPEGFEELLLLVYMGKRNHSGADIIKDQMMRDNLENFALQKKIAEQMKDALNRKDITRFGFLLNMAWLSKLRFSPYVATPKIKSFYKWFMNHGAIGAKLTGAGGGGFMLLMENPNFKGRLRKALRDKGIDYIDVHFNNEGVRICQ